MSCALVTPEDYLFFDFLAPRVWPNKTAEQIADRREDVARGLYQIETLLENALANASNGAYERIAEAFKDFCDHSDAKKVVSNFRQNNKKRDLWMNSFDIAGLENKVGLIRATCLSKQTGKFHHFAIPHHAYKGRKSISILLDTSTGYREPKGIPRGVWVKYEVDSFETLATITHKEAMWPKRKV